MTRNRPAFTLLELLVAIAIVMVLVAFVAVGLRGIRGSATRTRSLDALRHMSQAYSEYAGENDLRLMPGYLSQAHLAQLEIRAELADGTILSGCVGNPGLCDAGSYVWRLSTYLDHAWETFFTDTRDAASRSRIQRQFDLEHYGPSSFDADMPLGLSERPSFGMNSIFVGGDSLHGGDISIDRNPWDPVDSGNIIAATRMSEIRNPSKLIVFAPAALAGQGPAGDTVYSDPSLGSCELRPPFLFFNQSIGTWSHGQWTVGAAGLVEHLPCLERNAPGAGLPIDRVGTGSSVIPVGHIDGSAAFAELADLSRDMSRWSPRDSVRLPTSATCQ